MCQHCHDEQSPLRRRALRLFGREAKDALHFYLALGEFSRWPIIGSLVKWGAEEYGRHCHGGRAATVEECLDVVDQARVITAVDCACRKTFGNCANPINVCLTVNLAAEVFQEEKEKDPRQLNPTEAADILKEAQRKGLILSITHCMAPHVYAICCCCTCCCVPWRLRHNYGINSAVNQGRFVASINSERCRQCLNCQRTCPASAIAKPPHPGNPRQEPGQPQTQQPTGVPAVSEPSCMGCGLCRTHCPEQAISMVPRQGFSAEALAIREHSSPIPFEPTPDHNSPSAGPLAYLALYGLIVPLALTYRFLSQFLKRSH